MKLLKKILRIICIILPAFAVFFIAQPTSAASWPVNSYLSHGISTVASDGRKVNVATQPTLFLDNTTGVDFIHDMYFTSTLSNGKCQFSDIYRRGYSVYQREVVFGTSLVFPYVELLSQQNISDAAICQSYASFGGTGAVNGSTFTIPKYNNLSAPVGYQPDIGFVLPYSYDYAKVSKEKPSNWIKSSNFNITRIQGYTLPINYGAYDDLQADTNLQLRFGIVWPVSEQSAAHPNGWSDDFIQHGVIQAELKYVIGNTVLSKIVSCYTNDLSYSEVRCDIPIDQDIQKYHYGLSLHFGWPSGVNASSLFRYEFESFFTMYVITNGDSSLSTSSGEFQVGGNNVNNAPVLPPSDTSTDAWYNKFLNAFNFSLLNPFQSIFNMFQNSSECHHIPIISGMLNVEDDKYCPWFPATVRQITTPVISIAATMLLFGFFISFLKSSSGNDTIDTGGRNLKVSK